LGKQLDSLADVVSFGVAPGMILYQLLRLSFAGQEDGMDVSVVWFLPALVFPCAAAYRLARFNLDESQQYGFKGVPTPAAGLLIASLPLISWYTTNPMVTAAITNKWVLYGLIVLVAWLMTSNLPLMALKFTDYSVRGNWPKLILLGLAVVSAVFLKWLAVPAVFIFYIIVSLVAKNKQTNKTT
jgi:CDP-diacylglycerol--serine O-phosphatidyltransferase